MDECLYTRIDLEGIISIFSENFPTQASQMLFSIGIEYYDEYIWDTVCSSYEKYSLDVNSEPWNQY